MILPEDFLDAHERHYDDAQSLYAQRRWANADHLFGIAAECGLKALTVNFKGTPLAKNERRHISEASKPTDAWDIFESYRSGHVLAGRFALPVANPFTNWDVSQRYAGQSHFDQAVVDPHRDGANIVKNLINTARLEGLL